MIMFKISNGGCSLSGGDLPLTALAMELMEMSAEYQNSDDVHVSISAAEDVMTVENKNTGTIMR